MVRPPCLLLDVTCGLNQRENYSAITRSRAHELALTRAVCEVACHLGLRRGDDRGPEMFDRSPASA